MVFKTFERMSFGLIMEATDVIHVDDNVEIPLTAGRPGRRAPGVQRICAFAQVRTGGGAASLPILRGMPHPRDDTLAWLRLARTPALDGRDARNGARARRARPCALLAALPGTSSPTPDSARPPANTSTRASRGSSAELRWLEARRPSPCAIHRRGVPEAAASCAGRPIALYVAGQLDALDDPPLAVVGSRNPTPGGKDTAFEFSRILAARGLVIASGLAEGIDTAAHRGALAAQGLTLAVLGSGDRSHLSGEQPRLERAHYVPRCPDERLSLGYTAPAHEFSAAKSGHRCLESSALSWWRRRAASGSLITARAAQRLGQARVRGPRLDPQSP